MQRVGNTRTSNILIMFVFLVLSAPPPPDPHIMPKIITRTANTIKIEFSNNFFSNVNGKITSYTIIVAEDDTKDSSSLRMPTWGDVQQYPIWPPYQVNQYYCIRILKGLYGHREGSISLLAYLGSNLCSSFEKFHRYRSVLLYRELVTKFIFYIWDFIFNTW